MRHQGPVNRIVFFGAAAVVAATLCVLLARTHWFVELFAHYRPHLALGAVLIAVMALMSRRYIAGTLMLVLALFHASVLLVHWAPRNVAHAGSAPTMRVLALNMGRDNHRVDLVRSLIQREKPRVLALIEIDDRELTELLPSVSAYHRADFIDDSGFGVALFSIDPISSAQMIRLAGEPYPALKAVVERGERDLNVVVAHPPPPVNAEWAKSHGRQIDALHELLAEIDHEPTIVFADLNTSPWAPAFLRLVRGVSIGNAAIGFPYAPTWPAQLGVLGIPIDYCLTTPDISVIHYRTGPEVGSDHRPVIADILL